MNTSSQGFFFETLAMEYLQRQGLKLVGRNISGRFGELDLVMQDQTQLVFVEVKYRKNTGFGGPFAAVTASKQQKLRLTALAYLQQHAPKAFARFDVVGITGHEPYQVEWLKNAF